MTTKLERLMLKKNEILKQIRELENKELAKNKGAIDRKKRIVGEFFLEKYNKNMKELKTMLDPYLKKIGDRKLFGFKKDKK